MTSFPYTTLFSSTLVLGTILSISGSQWLFIWVGLELNLLSFVPLLTASRLNQETEAAMKYFLAQALGSGLLLTGGLSLNMAAMTLLPPAAATLVLLSGLLIKLGMPPCHFWFPAVMSAVSWPLCLLLSTWQKITPMFIILHSTQLTFTPSTIMVISAAALIGGIGGLNQSALRPLLAYSSIGHMAWMLGTSICSLAASIIYFVIYIFISASLMIAIWSISSSSPLTLSLTASSSLITTHITLLILSLGGIPPFLGFLPKWLTIQAIVPMSLSTAIILILGSILNLLYYLNLLFILFVKRQPTLLLPTLSPKYPHILPILNSTLLLISPCLFLLI
uniref:NADH-ubiquinone oxidoreductase chain 2 n=1 Tax=Panthalis oerstedi TaxID=318815 RepID=A0A343W6C9_9ANNE|nr:NADH dehydrogenase subunit 2 [Panthalis oerstedi]